MLAVPGEVGVTIQWSPDWVIVPLSMLAVIFSVGTFDIAIDTGFLIPAYNTFILSADIINFGELVCANMPAVTAITATKFTNILFILNPLFLLLCLQRSRRLHLTS